MGKSGVKNRKLAGIRETDFRKPASTLGGNGVGRKTRGKFFQIGEKGNVLTIKTHYGEDQKQRFFNRRCTRMDADGEGINAEALRRRRNAKRKGGARHAFHEGSLIWQNVGFNRTAAGRRLYGNSTKLWTDSFMTPSRFGVRRPSAAFARATRVEFYHDAVPVRQAGDQDLQKETKNLCYLRYLLFKRPQPRCG